MNHVDRRIDFASTVDSLMSELSEELQDTVSLVWLEGYTPEEAARFQGISLRQVFNRLATAREIAKNNPKVQSMAKEYGLL